MSKIALAFPALATMSAGTSLAIGAGLTAASIGVDAYGRKQNAKDQKKSNQQWQNFQDRQAQQFARRDEADQRRATAELDASLDAQDGESRAEVIDTEAARLEGEYAKDLPTASGYEEGSNLAKSEVFNEALAKKIGSATQDARGRMQAMARMQATGGNTMGSMGMTDALRNQDTGLTLSGINRGRASDLAGLQRDQQRTPWIHEYDQSPLVPVLGAAGSLFMGGGAQGLGAMFAGNAAAAGAPLVNSGIAAANRIVPSVATRAASTLAPIGYNGMTSGFA
jgi:hypothetical protein